MDLAVNIGMIAMSGVRVVDPELARLGLTLPGFVERGRVIASLPSLGLLTLAGMTPPRHRVAYHEVRDLRALESLPEGFDLIAISSLSAQVGEAYELADRYRALGVQVVMGGLHVTAMPDEAARHADAVVVGEGEPVWGDVLRDAEARALRPVYKSDGKFSLADAPMPAYALLDIEKYNRLTVQVSRGCPFRCEFCASSVLLTTRYKQKTVDKVLAEIDQIRGLWRRPFIEFADDNAFVDREYWKTLLPELKKRKVRWFAESDLSVHEDDDLLELMRESGCAEVLIGFESPGDSGLKGVELKHDWKLTHWREAERAISRIQAHGIRVNACFILGLDGQGPEIFDQVLEFVSRTVPFDVQITVQTPFAGTPLYTRLKREGRLLREDAWETCTLFDVNFRPQHMSAEELRTRFRDLGVRVYGHELTERRRSAFEQTYRNAVEHCEEMSP
jgi:radical SAM superfamily enzyme YgiQ (UPF0313 family)